MYKKYCFVISLLLMSGLLIAQNYSQQLDESLERLYQKYDLPGFSAMIVTKDSILYQQGFGLANIKSKQAFTPETLLNICSISKTFIAVAVMKAIEDGYLTMDTEVNDVLPFKVVHPKYPNIPITIWHLVTHTSGIKDSFLAYRKGYYMREKFKLKKRRLPIGYYNHAKAFNRNESMDYQELLLQLLSRRGKWYDAEDGFTKHAPGTEYKYSNTAAALAAYVVELVVGEKFAEYTQKNIFHPLGMKHTGWTFETIDENQLATLYFQNGQPIPKYQLILFPAGGLLSSTADLSLFLMEMMKGYIGEGRILKPTSYKKMFTVQFEGGDRPGVFWDIGLKTFSHNGGDQGVHTLMSFSKETLIGKILFTNTNAHWASELENQFQSIWKELYLYQGHFISRK